MRKNKKLLLASVAALGALAIGVGATSTFAWYRATNAATALGTKTPGSIASTSSTAGLGTFTMTVTIGDVNNIYLTNDSGATYVTDGTNNIIATSAGNAIVSPTVTLAVSYATAANEGPETITAGQILGLWQEASAGKTLTLTFTKNNPTARQAFDGNGTKVAFQLADTSLASAEGVTVKVGGAAGPAISSVSGGLVTLASAPAAGSGNVVIEYSPTGAASGGVKFTSGASDYKQDSGDNVYTIAESDFADFEVTAFSTPSGSKVAGWSSTATMTDGEIANKVFLGLIGLDNYIQDYWQYSYTFTATLE